MGFSNMEVSYNRTNVSYNDEVGYLKGLGRMFYIVDPSDSVFEKTEDVPNVYVQSWPYFFMFMLLEHIVLKLEGKKGYKLNDGLTSLSNGLFLESGRLVWRGAESYLYAWVYDNYRIVDLPWNSTMTWVLTAIGLDFCYYWMHRACHEIHILWAQHQVHHTSEYINMGVGIRQSALQGWCGIIFYLPLALGIPPAQFMLHHQFSYLYMFWIHTEAIKSLGPLEYILNTPSHHRIHHGSNPYCIDVNYGGVLIIWDKLFGTFRAEKDTDKIIYGLIFNQPSFNPLHLQTFYTRYVIKKFGDLKSWSHKMHAIFNRPSWAPGHFVRFKDLDEDPKIHVRTKYDVILPKWCTYYLLVHYAVILLTFYQLFQMHTTMVTLPILINVLHILGSLTVFGMILDASPMAPHLETLRCILTIVISKWLTPVYGEIGLLLIFAISASFWSVFIFKTAEIKAEKKGI